MLGKLIKYDTKDFIKNMIPIYLVLLVLAIFIRVEGILGKNIEIFKGIQIFMIFTFAVVAIISIGYCFLISIMNFYKKVLKDEGYLTNTLPVKKSNILTSKILVSTITFVISVFVILVCCIIAFYSKGMFSNIWEQIELNFSQINYNIYLFLGIMIIFILISYASAVSMVYCALSIGHSFSKNKIGYSVVAGVVLYFIYQILNIATTLIFVLSNIEILNAIQTNTEAVNIIQKIFIIAIANMLAIYISTYFTTNYQLKNRLNLD